MAKPRVKSAADRKFKRPRHRPKAQDVISDEDFVRLWNDALGSATASAGVPITNCSPVAVGDVQMFGSNACGPVTSSIGDVYTQARGWRMGGKAGTQAGAGRKE